MMTEPEAWREIARRFARGKALHGLCHEVGVVFDSRRISDVVYDTMCGRIDEHLGDRAWGYDPRIGSGGGYDHSEHREARCLAALWLALDAEADA